MSLEKAKSIIADAGWGVLATELGGQVRVRPMSFVVRDDLTLWSSTWRRSGKMAEFAANSRVEVCFTDSEKNHLRITGVIDTTGGMEKKQQLLELNPRVRRHFPEASAPEFVHLEIVPTSVRWTEPGFGEYHPVTLPAQSK